MGGRPGGVEPVAWTATALTPGAASAVQDGASEAVKGAYARLRDAIRTRLADRADGELGLTRHEAYPQIWQAPLAAELAQGVGDDASLTAAAQALMEIVDAAGARSRKYAITVFGSQGMQVGDRNTQTKAFGTS